MWLKHGNSFEWTTNNHTGRPASALGTSVTPAQNAKGSWAEILADLAFDVWAVTVIISGTTVAAQIKDTLTDIGIDPAGGTSYTTVIPNLVASGVAAVVNGDLGVAYHFPMHIPAGAAVAARSSVNNATVGTVMVYIQVWGKPTRPELVKKGFSVEAFGIDTANSRGTAVTCGTTSEGAWTELTSGTLSKDYFWAQVGRGVHDTTMQNALVGMDLAAGDASTKRVIVDQVWESGQTTEAAAMWSNPWQGPCYVPSGSRIYGRAQSSGAGDTMSMAAYLMPN